MGVETSTVINVPPPPATPPNSLSSQLFEKKTKASAAGKWIWSPIVCAFPKTQNLEQPTKILTNFFSFGVYFPKIIANFFRFSVTLNLAAHV